MPNSSKSDSKSTASNADMKKPKPEVEDVAYEANNQNPVPSSSSSANTPAATTSNPLAKTTKLAEVKQEVIEGNDEPTSSTNSYPQPGTSTTEKSGQKPTEKPIVKLAEVKKEEPEEPQEATTGQVLAAAAPIGQTPAAPVNQTANVVNPEVKEEPEDPRNDQAPNIHATAEAAEQPQNLQVQENHVKEEIVDSAYDAAASNAVGNRPVSAAPTRPNPAVLGIQTANVVMKDVKQEEKDQEPTTSSPSEAAPIQKPEDIRAEIEKRVKEEGVNEPQANPKNEKNVAEQAQPQQTPQLNVVQDKSAVEVAENEAPNEDVREAGADHVVVGGVADHAEIVQGAEVLPNEIDEMVAEAVDARAVAPQRRRNAPNVVPVRRSRRLANEDAQKNELDLDGIPSPKRAKISKEMQRLNIDAKFI